MNIVLFLGKATTIKRDWGRKACDKVSKTRFGLIVAVAFVLSLSGGMLIGYVNTPKDESEMPAENVTPVAIEEETLLHAQKTVTHYKVTVTDDCIILCEVFSDDTETELERAEINTSVLPKEDVKILKDGVAFADKDEALMLIENFVS